jgi:hypothetical protein
VLIYVANGKLNLQTGRSSKHTDSELDELVQALADKLGLHDIDTEEES